MNLRLWMLVVGLLMCFPAFAQEGEDIDLTKLTANRKTFVFNDSKHTVKKYINTQLQKETSCCGENDDRIYLEVRIDPTGYVVSAKAITGKNECFKQSAEDLVKRVKWEANDSRGPKSIYIELRPKVECVSGRDNNYVALKIFNNKLMDEEGNRVSMANTEKLVEMVTKESKPTPTPPAAEETKETVDAGAGAAKENVEEAAGKVAENTEKVAEETKEVVEKTTKEVAGAGAATEEKIAEATPMASTAEKEAAAPVEKEMTPEEKEAADKAAAAQAVKAEEINKLREQMAALKAKKAEDDAKQAAIEKKRQAREERRQRALAAREEKRRQQEAANADPNDWSNGQDAEGSDDGSWTDGEDTGSMSEADRLREEIKRLQDQEMAIEQNRQQRQDEVRRQMDENDRSNQEMIQLAEERLRMEEQLRQVEEQEEIDLIEKDRQTAEDARREQENEYQRILDEVNRLQQEAQLKIQDLERQKSDLDALQARKQAREQEIMLARATRELEREAELERIRLDVVNSSLAVQGGGARGLSSSAASTIDEEALLNEILPNLTTEADSEKLVRLLQEIQRMRDELVILRSQIATMDATAGTSGTLPPTSISPNVGPSRSADDPNVKSAADIRSWEGVSYTAPGVDKDKYIVNRSNTPPPTNTGQEGPTRPDPSNPDTHDNMEIPKFAPRNYVDGVDAMKNLIKDRLRLGGVCGLAHTVFSVTLDPGGNVVAFSVLTSNDANVQRQMNTIIPTLKFNAVDQRFNQTIYQEVKAEILCNGAEDKVNLKDVKDLIKNNENK
ncbi:MAG: hypothetical protein AAGD28_12295 [Bacteroidota bacterium]